MARIPESRNRRSTRLKGYDYSSNGAYFISIVTQGRSLLFGDVVDSEMHLNDAGEMVQRCWEEMPKRFPSIAMDQFIVMPNHMHGVVVIQQPVVDVGTPLHQPAVGAPLDQPAVGAPLVGAQETGTTTRVAPTRLGDVIGAFKSLTTLEYSRGVDSKGWQSFDKRLWQRNYHEHIIRNEREFEDIREYIWNNPLAWDLDKENPLRGDSRIAQLHGL